MDLGSLHNTVTRLKESMELITGQSRDQRYSMPNMVQTVERRSGEATARFSEELTVTASSIEAVASRTTTLEVTMNNVEASVVAEQVARVNGDNALAFFIIDVEAIANAGTASGQIYISAESAPAGYTAKYGWRLTAGNTSIGMAALLTSGGVGEIAFTADTFKLIDPSYLGGAPATVFNYNGTTFNFDVPVTIRNEEIGANAVTNTATNAANVSASGGVLTANLTTRDNADVLVSVGITDTTATVTNDGASPTTVVTYGFDVQLDGVNTGHSLYSTKQVYSVVAGSNFRGLTPASAQYRLTGRSAGAHSFSIVNTAAAIVGLYITVTELADR
jgi:hypothetical protein